MADDPTKPATGDPKDDLGDAGKKALEDERKARRDAEKRAVDAERRLSALEADQKRAADADKSEAEKMNERLAAAEKRVADAEARAMRTEVAAAKGLTPAQAKRLSGSSIEELTADADDLLASFPKPSKTGDAEGEPPTRKGTPATRPTERLKPGGAEPGAEPEELDPSKLASAIPRR